MAKLNLDLNQFKASGVYTLEYDESITNVVDTDSLRLAVGFSKKGPFNRPVYIDSQSNLVKVFGNIDTKLERKGCFFNRSIQTLLNYSPVFALNLLKVDQSSTSTDKTQLATIGLNAEKTNDPSNSSTFTYDVLYSDLYDKSRFWIPSEDYLLTQSKKSTDSAGADMYKTSILNFANVGTDNFSLLVYKASPVGYNITAKQWYGSEDNIPYAWILPNSYMVDYFITVKAVAGKWNDYASLSTDPYWSTYFSATGIKKEMVSKFLNLDGVTLLGSWTGTIIPNFYDKTGALQSIVPQINSNVVQTGLLAGLNEELMESLTWDTSVKHWTINGDSHTDASVWIDMIGNDASTDTSVIKFMSYNESRVNGSFCSDLGPATFETPANIDMAVTDSSTVLIIDSSAWSNDDLAKLPAVGDYLISTLGYLTRISKKSYDSSNGFKFTCLDPIATTVSGADVSVYYVKQIENITTVYNFIPLEGLKITTKHLPGYDASGNVNPEAGVEKIYSVLEDNGINRGLLNPEMINYRYIIDTMGYGLNTNLGGKVYLSRNAMNRGECTAILSLPSITQFANSTTPYFCDTFVSGAGKPIFNTKYIPEGGNNEMATGGSFSLPDEINGSKFCGVFSPYLKYTSDSKTILVPPAADVANAYVLKLQGGDPYITVANLNGILSNNYITGLEYSFDKTDREYLEPYGINPIITRGSNIVIFGDRTAYQDVISDFNYLHVRELLNTIEIKGRAILENYVFTYNNAEVRQDVTKQFNSMLQPIQNSGALYNFEVICDESNNTADVIARSVCIVDIALEITKNMEKIIQRITVKKSE